MTIVCHTLEKFFATIAAMVERGLQFKAYTDSLTIELTGGF